MVAPSLREGSLVSPPPHFAGRPLPGPSGPLRTNPIRALALFGFMDRTEICEVHGERTVPTGFQVPWNL